MAVHKLDTRGLTCPVPIMLLKKSMESLPRGHTLRILATDPSCVTEFETYARNTGNSLIESGRSTNGDLVFVLKKASRRVIASARGSKTRTPRHRKPFSLLTAAWRLTAQS